MALIRARIEYEGVERCVEADTPERFMEALVAAVIELVGRPPKFLGELELE
jgi:hypothetical protein